ncbi:tetratricopeptide repeat protein [Aestuariibius insulae]|uniref:tetratricopeptide repeat protein n=1 Tax=Aestuariibius insulae TaxID=2058287 RepID=UPI00345E0B25
MSLTESEQRAALARLLDRPAISRSDRSTSLLKYLGEASISGRELTPYAIAFDVFGRGDDFDPSTDPIVRVAMARLRKALDQDAKTDGAEDAVRISLPQRSYRLRFARQAARAGTKGTSTSWLGTSRIRRIGVTAALLLAVVIGSLAVLYRADASAIPPSERPITGILPFANLTGEERLDFLGTGIQHQIASDLWRFQTMRVFTIYDPAELRVVDGRLLYVPEDLEVDYLLSGAILSNEAAMSISTSLRRADSNTALWRNRDVARLGQSSYSDLLTDMSARISAEVGQPLGVVGQDVLDTLGDGIGLDQNEGVDSYVCLLRYAAWVQRGSDQGAAAASACLDRIVRDDPANASALAARAWILALSTDASRGFYQPGNLDGRRQRALSLALDAVQASPGSDFVHTHLGLVQWINGQEEAALESFRRSMALNPSDPQHMADLALFGCLYGRCDEAEPLSERALSLTAQPPAWYFVAPLIYALMDSDYDTALGYSRELIRSGDRNDCGFIVAAAVFADQPDLAEACAGTIAENRDLFDGDPLGGLRFWVRSEPLIEKLEEAIAQSGL